VNNGMPIHHFDIRLVQFTQHANIYTFPHNQSKNSFQLNKESGPDGINKTATVPETLTPFFPARQLVVSKCGL
jgi:hypothetical protein